MSHFNLNQDNEEQIYGIGIKELWQVQPEKHKPGTIEHTVGWPLPVGQDVWKLLAKDKNNFNSSAQTENTIE